jgi:hypothetical protein
MAALLPRTDIRDLDGHVCRANSGHPQNAQRNSADFNRKKPLARPVNHAFGTPYLLGRFKIFASANNLEGGVYKFDYNAPAELYPGRNRKSAKKVNYRRFETAADAIRFAIEELPELLLLGACIEINEQRLNYKDIQALYASEQYPLEKRSLA